MRRSGRWLLLPACVLMAVLVALVLRRDDAPRAESARGSAEVRAESIAVDPGHPSETERAPAEESTNRIAPDAPSASTGVVEGTVRARFGGVWGVRIAAFEPGDATRSLGETHTDRDGRYALRLDAPCTFDLAAQPGEETKLPGAARSNLALRPGETIVVDFQLEESGRSLRGTIEGLTEPVAVRAARLERRAPFLLAAGVDRELLRELPGESGPARPNRRGVASFVIDGLQAGRYRLFLDDPGWMLLDPPVVDAADQQVRLRATRALSIRIRVAERGTTHLLGRFEGWIDLPGAAPLGPWPGHRGLLRGRVPLRTDAERAQQHPEGARLRIEADGYATELLPFPIPLKHTLELTLLADPNLELVLRSEGGGDITGPLRLVQATGDDPEAETWMLEIGSDRTVRVRARPGRCTLTATLKGSALELQAKLETDLPGQGLLTRELILPAAGSIHVTHADPESASELTTLVLEMRDPPTPSDRAGHFEPLRRGSKAFLSEQFPERIFSMVPAGAYRCIARAGGETWETTLQVRGGERVEVVVPGLSARR